MSAFGLVREGERVTHQLFFAPFADPLLPEAKGYVFAGTAFGQATLDRLGKEAIHAEIDAAWRKLFARFNLQAVAPEMTIAEAMLPYWTTDAAALHAQLASTPTSVSVVDVNTAFSSGAPGVALDGMACQAAGAHAFVNAFDHREVFDNRRTQTALLAADRKMKPVRRINRVNVWIYYLAKRLVRVCLFATSTQASLSRLNEYFNRLGSATDREQTPSNVIVAIGPNIWTLHQRPPGLIGFSTRMTIVRLTDGGLVLISPVRMAPSHLAELRELGTVRFIVAPNLSHHLSLAACRQAFPDAAVYVPPGFAEKLPAQAAGTRALDAQFPSAELTPHFIAGHANNETVFVHRASKTLIVTDLAYHVGGEVSGIERLWFRLFGVLNGGRISSYNRTMVKDPVAFLAAWAAVLGADVERVSVAHGRLIVHRPKETLRAQWLPLALP